MAETGIDWVGLAGILGTILGTLGGVIVGAFGTWKIQQQQLKHADETRFQEQRMEAYTNYISCVVKTAASLSTEQQYEETAILVLSTLGTIKLIGSPETVEWAQKVHTAFGTIIKANGEERKRIATEMIRDQSGDLLSAVQGFREAARRELRV